VRRWFAKRKDALAKAGNDVTFITRGAHLAAIAAGEMPMMGFAALNPSYGDSSDGHIRKATHPWWV